MSNRDWCLGQTVRQMDTDEVVDLVVRLTDERDQALIRAQLAENELEAYRAERLADVARRAS
mgnify:CR=1 FL=1